MKKFAKLTFQSKELILAIILLVALMVIGGRAYARPGDDMGPNWQDAFIALYVTFATFIVFEGVKIYSLYGRYRSYEGEYQGYAYAANDPSEKGDSRYDQLAPDPVSRASLRYVGGHDFTLELSNPASGDITHTWQGSLKMTAENMADIGYRYTKSPKTSLKHSAGYKRAVIFQEEDEVIVHMFSNDGQRFGREVLIKSS